MSATTTTPATLTPLWVDERGGWTILATTDATVRTHYDGTVCVMGGHIDGWLEMRTLSKHALRLAALYQDREAHRQSGLAWEADPCASWRDPRYREGIARAKAGIAACDRELAALGFELVDREGEEYGS